METLIRWTLQNRLLTLFIAALIAVLGVWSWVTLPIEAVPDVTSVQVTVVAKAPGLATEEVEQQVTVPIEERLSGIHRVEQVRSTSRTGWSEVVVTFSTGVDLLLARQLVGERLLEVRRELSPHVHAEVAPVSNVRGEVFQYTLDGDSLSLMERRTLQDRVVAPRLRAIPGVAAVESSGGLVRQVQVVINPDLLGKSALELRDVVEVLERNNVNAVGKDLLQEWNHKYVRTVGILRSASDLENTVVRVRSGVPILIRDVAEVVIGHETHRSAVTKDGAGETVAGRVFLTHGVNSSEVLERINRVLPEIRKSLPPEVGLNVFYDRRTLIAACRQTMTTALVEGGFWVVPVLVILAAELQTGLLMGLSLPLTFLLTFLLMNLLGVSANLMSLGGLAFAVGLVGNASVVIVENLRRRLASADPDDDDDTPIFPAAIAEVARPTVYSVLIVVLVVLPLLWATGMEADILFPFLLTLVLVLSASLVIAFLLMPVLASYVMPRGRERVFFLNRLMRFCYEFVLHWSLRVPGVTVFLALFGFLTAIRLLPLVGFDFMPVLNEGTIVINAVRSPDTSLDDSVKVATEIEKYIARFPETATVVTRSGPAEQTDFIVALKAPGRVPFALTQAELITSVRSELLRFPGLRYSYSQPLAGRANERLFGLKSDVAVKVFGEDPKVAAAITQRVAEITASVTGAHDTRARQIADLHRIDVVIDREAAGRHGIDVSRIHDLVETGIGGKIATQMPEGRHRIAIEVRFPEPFRGDLEAIGRLALPGKDGLLVPLTEVARLRRVTSPLEMVRENGRRHTTVEVNVRGRDLGGFVDELKSRLEPFQKELPAGYSLEFGGAYASQQQAMDRLSHGFPLVPVVIAVLLVLALGSLLDALVVLLSLPFALAGGVTAMVLGQVPLSVTTGVAFVILLGLAVQDGLLLVTILRQRLQDGAPLEEAIREGCSLRFRTWLLISVTTFVGYLPLVWSVGAGAETQYPQAVVIMGGIAASGLTTMLVLPVIFRWMEQLAQETE